MTRHEPRVPVLKPKLRKSVLRLLAIGLALYVAAALAVLGLQRRMIFHPGHADARVMLAMATKDGFAPWLNATGQRIGWQRTIAESRGRALIVHGNAGMALDRTDYAADLQEASGFDVFILEYPGYADRAGAPAETTIVAAADEAFGLLAKAGPVHVVGESLGTGVAAHLAARHPGAVAGLLLFTPYNNLTAVAGHHMPIFPVRWMLRDRFDSDEHLQRYQGPVGMLLAGRDEVVPDRFGRLLFAGYHGPKQLWEAPQAGHNDVFQRPAAWWKEVVRFWQTNQPPATR